MTQKPTHEELEHKVQALEKEIVDLKLVEERLNTALKYSPIPTAMGGSDGSILIFNKALEKLTGYKKSEIRDVAVWAEKLYPGKKYRDFV